jgi:hypothetical protein
MDKQTRDLQRQLNWVMFYYPQRDMPDFSGISNEGAKYLLHHFTDLGFKYPIEEHRCFVADLARSFEKLPSLEGMPEDQQSWLLRAIHA